MAMSRASTPCPVTADTTILMVPTAGPVVQHDAEALVTRTVKDWLDARK